MTQTIDSRRVRMAMIGGGPGSGPTIKQNTNMANTALRWRVQRVI